MAFVTIVSHAGRRLIRGGCRGIGLRIVCGALADPTPGFYQIRDKKGEEIRKRL